MAALDDISKRWHIILRCTICGPLGLLYCQSWCYFPIKFTRRAYFATLALLLFTIVSGKVALWPHLTTESNTLIGYITLNPSQTYVCDLSATDNLHQSQRSQQGPRLVPARLQRSRRLIGDLVATKSVAARFLCLHKRLAATDLVADRSRQSRRPVADQSPTSRRLILLESGRGYDWN